MNLKQINKNKTDEIAFDIFEYRNKTQSKLKQKDSVKKINNKMGCRTLLLLHYAVTVKTGKQKKKS